MGGRLVPIPMGWAPFFLDYPTMGTTFRRMIFLMRAAAHEDRGHLRPFAMGIALACGTARPSGVLEPTSTSALDSQWKRVPYTKPSLAGATAVWEGAARGDPQVPNEFDSLFGGQQQQDRGKDGREPARSRPPPPNASRRTGPRGPTAAEWQASQRGPTTTEHERAERTESTDFGMAIRALVEAQSAAQIALANTQHTNLIALHTATAQALATKSGDKDSKLTAAKRRILQACAGTSHVDEFEAEPVFKEMDAEGGTTDALGRILRKRLRSLPLSPHKTNIHVSPQLVATVKLFNLSANGDKTYVNCTKGITPFAVPWKTAEAIKEDLVEDGYFEASTLKTVEAIRKHATSAKVELPTTLHGVVRLLNNYCRLLDVLFGAECAHLAHVMDIRNGLEFHEDDLESRLTTRLIVHLLWQIHQDARQFFLACEGWDDGEMLPHSTLDSTVLRLVNDCSIELSITCPEAQFLGTPAKAPGAKVPATTTPRRPSGPQPTVNASIPPGCQKVVAAFNKLYPSMTILELCTRGKVRFGNLKVGKDGACVNFGLLGRCPGCNYRHEVCTVSDSRQAAIVKVLEGAMATMKAAAVP